MFIEDADKRSLRQGDIISGIYFPLSRLRSAPKVLGTYTRGAGQKVELAADTEQIGKSWWLLSQINTALSFCAVLSQDCDVDSSQEKPPPSFVLCRLVPVPESIKQNKSSYEVLKENIDPYRTDRRPFYQLFYIGVHASLDGEYIVDCGQAMTVVWKDYDSVLKKKILQMDDLNRAKFRVKAGAHFGRATPEEKIAGLEDPWRNDATGQRVIEPFSQRLVRACRIIFGKE